MSMRSMCSMRGGFISRSRGPSVGEPKGVVLGVRASEGLAQFVVWFPVGAICGKEGPTWFSRFKPLRGPYVRNVPSFEGTHKYAG
jgi:hypothetical protein